MKCVPRASSCARWFQVITFLIVLSGMLTSVTVAQSRKQTLIFAVSSESGEASIDAVAVLVGKRLRAPYTDEQKDKQKDFAADYFKQGTVYRLIFGGGEGGTATINKWSEGCNNIHAQATISTSAKLGGKVMALATNSDALGKRSMSRRPPTEAERAATLALMKTIYQQRRTPGSLMSAIKVTNLTASDLNGDGKFEMIGSFTLTARNKFQRDLFLIATPQGSAMRAEFVKFQAYQPPAEGFLSSIDFIDQLDVDGDGTGEVFATMGAFDGYAYVVFKKTGTRWRQVHDTIGDLC